MATTLFNVNEFKNTLNDGGIRPNQFSVQLTFPAFVTNAQQVVRKAPFLISVAELPGSTVNPAIVFYRGREVKFAGDRIFPPWTITILNDGDMSIRRAMEQWLNGVDDLQFKRGVLPPASYQCQLEVRQLDRNGLQRKLYILQGAFPIDVSPIGLDFGANDTISTFSVTWQYQDYTTDF